MFDRKHLRIEKGSNFNFDISEFNNEFVSFHINKSNIVLYDNKVLGFYNVTNMEQYNAIMIDYALANTMQGKKLGQEYLNIIVDIVSEENNEYENVLLIIRNDNYKSKVVASKNGFSVDFDLLPEINSEMKGYIPFIKKNEYYSNKKLYLQKS